MLENEGLLTGDDDTGSGSLLDGLADLISALGSAATSIIGALNSGSGSGVITVQQPPTATGFAGQFDLLTVGLIAAGVWFIAKQ